MPIIGIDASRAFLRRRTGIEEYAYQVIKHLRNELGNAPVVLYVRKKVEFGIWNLEFRNPAIDFDIPVTWTIRALWGPRFWTQLRLSLEMWLHPPDVLLVPAHTIPWMHPRRTIVVVHGLEYEICPGAYSFWERFYMRLCIRYSCRVAERVIAVSENTKRDLIRLYGIPSEKIIVIYEGCALQNFKFHPPVGGSNFKSNQNDRISNNKQMGHSELSEESRYKRRKPYNSGILHFVQDDKRKPYFLFLGRLEERKNTVRMIEAFEMFKEKTGLPHKLVLAGKPGYGFERVNYELRITNYAKDIILSGYVTEEQKWQLLKNTDAFLFPSLYEGFGLPVLEAQSVGTPVITSNNSSLPEVAGQGALFVDPIKTEEIARAMEKLVSDPKFKSAIIEKGHANVARFSWEKCAKEIARLIILK